MVWSQLELTDPHIAYACVGVFSTLFSLVSLFVKERLFIGEATVATIAGLIFGPHCLNWFDPLSWGDSEIITLEISRIVLCVQIVAVAVELPRKYMKKHWLSVAIFLLPVMTIGWLVVGLFIWLLIPHFRFGEALLVSACVTATDPVLAAAVVGKGKFAERVPGHLRNLLSAESGCNDGMAFPFIFLSLNLLIHPGNAGEIVKDWIVITILYQCIFGIVLGSIIGYVLRKLVALAEKRNIIDRESFLAFFIFLAFNSAGFGSILGVDDLLVAFAAGTAFGWNGDFAKKTEESHVSTVIDLIINLAFFVYFGAIIPWADFNNSLFGLDIWRLVVLALVIIFLRRLPAVVALKPFTPDLKSWREAFFCGHFGPIGVGAIFAVILARRDLEEHFHVHSTGLDDDAIQNEPHYRLLNALWPIVNFVVITSIVVHGSSVAVLTLGKRLNRMAITMTFTSQNDQTGNWLSRLHNLERTTTSFSLHRVDSDAVTLKDSETGVGLDRHDTVETSGIKYRPAGGAKRKSTKNRRKKRKGSRHNLIKTISRSRTHEDYDNEEESRPRPPSQFLQLGNTLPLSKTNTDNIPVDKEEDVNTTQPDTTTATESPSSSQNKPQEETPSRVNEGATAYEEGRKIIIEDASGEVIETLPIKETKKPESPKTTKPKRPHSHIHNQEDIDNLSLHSMTSLNRHLTQYSSASTDSNRLDTPQEKNETASIAGSRKAYYKKNDPTQRKVFAHQIDDLILIENEDGEIIRRYKVNRHASTRRPRSDSVVNKALSFVGIKRNTKNQEQAGDLEKNSPILTPEYDAGVPELNNKRIEQKLENHLNNALVQTNKTTTQLPIPTIREHHIDEHLDEEDEDEDQDEDDEDYDDEYDSDMSENSNVSLDSDIQDETAVERSRRLAALGHTTIQRDEEDEED